MRSEFIKSRTDLSKYGFAITISLLFIILNLVSVKAQIEIFSDTLLNPVLANIRSFGYGTNILYSEIINKPFVLQENIELKKKNAELEASKSENDELKRKITDLEAKTKESTSFTVSYKKLNVRGVQNLYSSSPSVILNMERDSQLRKNDVVYYLNGYLFGLVKSTEGLSAEVLPFYSHDLGFQVPVQSSKDPSQVGFVTPIDNGSIKIKNVSKNASVSIGDIWVTTNDRAEIPGNLIVGKVKVVRENTETGFKELELEPPFDALILEELLVR